MQVTFNYVPVESKKFVTTTLKYAVIGKVTGDVYGMFVYQHHAEEYAKGKDDPSAYMVVKLTEG